MTELAAALAIDPARETERIAARLAEIIVGPLKRRGAVIGLSGGIDSSVCAALAVRALGKDKVVALAMPDRESSGSSERLARMVAEGLGVEITTQEITGALEALGAYTARDRAMRAVIPGYGPGWKSKLVIAGGGAGFHFFKLVAQAPSGEMHEARLPAREYLEIVAAQNHKQRLRKTIEYHHADRLNYAVIGTPNRLEYDQGFFVKNGDGSADVKPIAHLYKTQVYALARHLGLPAEVIAQRPTTDTYSLGQGQDEFYFGLPYEKMDVALWARNHDVPAAELGAALGMAEKEAAAVYRSIDAKREATRYHHAPPLLIEKVAEVRPLGTA